MVNGNETDDDCCEFELDIEIELWFICSLCKCAFETQSELQSHTELAHPQSPTLFRSVYLDALRLKESHTIKNVSTSFTVLRKQELKRDRKTFSGSYSDQIFQCDICWKKFSRKSSLKRHIRYHMEGKILSCEFCGMQFRKEHRLTTHKEDGMCIIATR